MKILPNLKKTLNYFFSKKINTLIMLIIILLILILYLGNYSLSSTIEGLTIERNLEIERNGSQDEQLQQLINLNNQAREGLDRNNILVNKSINDSNNLESSYENVLERENETLIRENKELQENFQSVEPFSNSKFDCSQPCPSFNSSNLGVPGNGANEMQNNLCETQRSLLCKNKTLLKNK